MDRSRLTSAAVAGLVVLVVGLAAATLGETTQRSETGVTGGSSGGAGSGGGSLARDVVATGEPIPFLTLVAVLVALVLVAGAIRYPLQTLTEVGRMAAIAGLVLGVLWLLLNVLPVQPPEGDDQQSAPAGLEGVGGGGPGASEGGTMVPTPELLGILVVGLLAVGLLAIVVRNADVGPDNERSAEADAETLAAIGRSAGRAADRLGESDAVLDNEVYVAWKEMTEYLDLEHADARTPGEFRTAALGAGMAAPDVDDLTVLFEEVRYGGAPATDEREARATRALRRIEDRYAGADEDETSSDEPNVGRSGSNGAPGTEPRRDEEGEP
jgi:hypothetical protein